MLRRSSAPVNDRRRGIVLLAVLVVIVLLSLSVYHYSDLAFSDYKAADLSQKQAQALALADSGVHYAAALVSSSDAMTNTLSGNPYHNPSMFYKIAVTANSKNGHSGTFTCLAPPDPQDTSATIRYGVIDESGKINLVSLLQWDQNSGQPAGQFAQNMLSAIPNMDSDTAASIIDWIDSDDNALAGGAESDYYSSLNPPYMARNTIPDSLEELLFVKGVTPDFLFGQYRNPFLGLPGPGTKAYGGGGGGGGGSGSSTSSNASASSNNNSNSSASSSAAPASPGSIDMGWFGALTIYSREQNVTLTGQPLIYLNDSDLNNLSTNLLPLVGASLTNFIILVRQNGATPIGGSSSSGSSSSSSSSSGSSSNTQDPAQANLNLSQQGTNTINSLFALVNVQVTVSSGQSTVTYASPLNDSGNLAQYFPILYNATTLTAGTDTPARINIFTAPEPVLQALTTITDSNGNPYLSSTDVQTILSTRPSTTSGQPITDEFSTPLWLITQANLSPTNLSNLEPYITMRSQVYRVHVQGVLDGQGLTARVEAIIDTNGGQPRILAWRNLTELGRQQIPQQ